MKGKHTLLAVALIGALTLAGTAAAVTVTNWDGTNDVSDTLDVSNDTESLRVMAENVTNQTANVTVYGINADGNQTQVTTATLQTNQTAGVYTDTYDYSTLNATKYPQYQVNVSGDGADSVEIARVDVITSGGGGGILAGTTVPTKEIGAALSILGIVGGIAVARRY